jgi:hypothetical protein
MKQSDTVIHSDPEIMGGTPVFVGTRVRWRRCWTITPAFDDLFGRLSSQFSAGGS